MKHAIKTLETEWVRLQMHLSVAKRDGKPSDYRASEWAMTVSQWQRQADEVAAAIKHLRGASND